MVKSSEGQQSATNREGQSPKQSGALEKEGGGGKVGYETELEGKRGTACSQHVKTYPRRDA